MKSTSHLPNLAIPQRMWHDSGEKGNPKGRWGREEEKEDYICPATG